MDFLQGFLRWWSENLLIRLFLLKIARIVLGKPSEAGNGATLCCPPIRQCFAITQEKIITRGFFCAAPHWPPFGNPFDGADRHENKNQNHDVVSGVAGFSRSV
ncbi:MAG: hypothetical protein LBG65_02105 [Puniceicoccales bacterium]|jgi:hypothetical protein|nr:hypothetical protein [Puniceicoccales bacterium]